jgi:hypothetical protein
MAGLNGKHLSPPGTQRRTNRRIEVQASRGIT